MYYPRASNVFHGLVLRIPLNIEHLANGIFTPMAQDLFFSGYLELNQVLSLMNYNWSKS